MVYCAGKLIEAFHIHAFPRVLPTSRVGHHAGKPIESVVYCLTNLVQLAG